MIIIEYLIYENTINEFGEIGHSETIVTTKSRREYVNYLLVSKIWFQSVGKLVFPDFINYNGNNLRYYEDGSLCQEVRVRDNLFKILKGISSERFDDVYAGFIETIDVNIIYMPGRSYRRQCKLECEAYRALSKLSECSNLSSVKTLLVSRGNSGRWYDDIIMKSIGLKHLEISEFPIHDENCEDRFPLFQMLKNRGMRKLNLDRLVNVGHMERFLKELSLSDNFKVSAKELILRNFIDNEHVELNHDLFKALCLIENLEQLEISATFIPRLNKHDKDLKKAFENLKQFVYSDAFVAASFGGPIYPTCDYKNSRSISSPSLSYYIPYAAQRLEDLKLDCQLDLLIPQLLKYDFPKLRKFSLYESRPDPDSESIAFRRNSLVRKDLRDVGEFVRTAPVLERLVLSLIAREGTLADIVFLHGSESVKSIFIEIEAYSPPSNVDFSNQFIVLGTKYPLLEKLVLRNCSFITRKLKRSMKVIEAMRLHKDVPFFPKLVELGLMVNHKPFLNYTPKSCFSTFLTTYLPNCKVHAVNKLCSCIRCGRYVVHSLN